MAWVVLWGSFVVFSVIFLVIVFTIVNVYRDSSYGQEAKLTIVGGTVLARSGAPSLWIQAEQDFSVKDGYSIRTDEVSQAFATLFDYSTVLALSGTEIRFLRMDSPRFSDGEDVIELSLEWGKVHLGVSRQARRDKQFRLTTPQGVVGLVDGSFSVGVDEAGTHLRVRERGKAWVEAMSQRAELGANESIDITLEGRLTTPSAAPSELVFNGDFTQGLSGWQVGQYLGFQESKDVEGKALIVLEDGIPALRFVRSGSKGTHSEVYIYQEMDGNVSDFGELYLSLDLKLLYQNLSGGGYMGSEYPLIIRVNYRVAGGAESSVLYGFYYENEAGNRTDNGAKLSQNQWYRHKVPLNLMSLSPKPQRIVSTQVSASGWDYDSMVRRVSLAGK